MADAAIHGHDTRRDAVFHPLVHVHEPQRHRYSVSDRFSPRGLSSRLHLPFTCALN